MATNPVQRRSRENGRRTRQRLLASAVALWSEQGELGVTVSAVAERAGTTRRTVYHHFPTHEALIAATREYVDTELESLAGGDSEQLEDPYALVPGLVADNPELIRSILSRMLGSAPADNPMYTSGVRYWSGTPALAPKLGVPPEHIAAITIGMWFAADISVSARRTAPERRREAERFARTYERLLREGVLTTRPAEAD